MVPKREEGREQRKERREKREERKGPPARFTAFFTGSRGHLDESAKNNIELPRVSFAKVLKIRGCYEEGRQLDSLHFYRVPWPPRVRAKRAQQKGFKLRLWLFKARANNRASGIVIKTLPAE